LGQTWLPGHPPATTAIKHTKHYRRKMRPYCPSWTVLMDGVQGNCRSGRCSLSRIPECTCNQTTLACRAFQGAQCGEDEHSGWDLGRWSFWALAWPARCMLGGCQLVWKKSTPRTKSNATASRHPIFAIVGSMGHRDYHTQHTGLLHAHASQTGLHIRTQPGQAPPSRHLRSPPARGFAHILA
jgi:hypothetical protein